MTDEAAMAGSPEVALRRMERTAVAACGLMAVGALVLGAVAGALGVLAGGTLVALNYLLLKGVAVAIVGRASAAPAAPGAGLGPQAPGLADGGPQRLEDVPGGAEGVQAGEIPQAEIAAVAPRIRRRYRVVTVVAFVLRYALLAVGAYVMLVRLRLDPIGVVAGVSSPVAAVAAEALRTCRAVPRRNRPR